MAVNQRKPPRVEIAKNPNFRVVHSNGIFGGLNPVEGSIAFFTDILEPKMRDGAIGEMELDSIKREMQVEIRMNVQEFIALADWMNAHIKRLKDQGILKNESINPEKKKLDYGV
jgi:hypothetical protein